MKAPTCVAFSVLLFVMLMAGETQVSMAIICNPIQLSPCANAITSSSPPTAMCCSKLKEQRPCLCQYVKNPNLQKLVNSPNARKVASTCGSPFPSC